MFTQIKILLCSYPGNPYPDIYMKYLLENIKCVGRDFYIDGTKLFGEWVWTYNINDNDYDKITTKVNIKIIELVKDKNLLYGNCY